MYDVVDNKLCSSMAVITTSAAANSNTDDQDDNSNNNSSDGIVGAIPQFNKQADTMPALQALLQSKELEDSGNLEICQSALQ